MVFDLPISAAIGVVIAVLAVVLAILWMAAESHYRSCIAEAEAKFPAEPVSAFASNPADVGPLKLSFVDERAKAVDDCSRFL